MLSIIYHKIGIFPTSSLSDSASDTNLPVPDVRKAGNKQPDLHKWWAVITPSQNTTPKQICLQGKSSREIQSTAQGPALSHCLEKPPPTPGDHWEPSGSQLPWCHQPLSISPQGTRDPVRPGGNPRKSNVKLPKKIQKSLIWTIGTKRSFKPLFFLVNLEMVFGKRHSPKGDR